MVTDRGRGGLLLWRLVGVKVEAGGTMVILDALVRLLFDEGVLDGGVVVVGVVTDVGTAENGVSASGIAVG